ncbi:protease complex subunit PrcB family protein [Mariniflexile sp.]|uniref:protease complex subunit PrcB family protein n=1 Tax=Mariniflexile sp. TaxID=1979402 RepID=UPI0040483831
MKTLIFVATIFISLISCNENDSISQNTNIEFTKIAEGFLGGQGSEGIPEQNIVINNETDWNNLKSKMNTNHNETDSFLETEIDFSINMVIASFSDLKNYGGIRLKIDKVVNNSKNIIVSTKFLDTSDENVTFNIIQPYYIAKIPKNDLPVVFE